MEEIHSQLVMFLVITVIVFVFYLVCKELLYHQLQYYSPVFCDIGTLFVTGWNNRPVSNNGPM